MREPLLASRLLPRIGRPISFFPHRVPARVIRAPRAKRVQREVVYRHMRHAIATFFTFPILLCAVTCFAAAPPPLRVALLGNPNTVPEWTDEQVTALKDAGFNAVQLNVAWGSRPQNEPLNLNDVVGL